MRLFRNFPSLILLTALLTAQLPEIARADALADLRSRLESMRASENLRATVDFEDLNQDGDSDKPHITNGKVSAQVVQTAGNLSIQWSQATLQQAAQEVQQHKADPEVETPTRTAISDLNAYALQQDFNGAEQLSTLLEKATLDGEQTEILDGKPMRVLLYSAHPALSKHDRKYIKEIEAGGKIWLDAEGYPVALDDRATLRGSIFLVIRFTVTQHDEYRYARIGNHLVATHHMEEGGGSGGGEHGQTRQVTDLQFMVPETLAKTP